MERGGSVRDRPQQVEGAIFRIVVHAGRDATADENVTAPLGPVSDRARPGMERGGSVRDRPQQVEGAIFRIGV
jgi:hypothetical protein